MRIVKFIAIGLVCCIAAYYSLVLLLVHAID